MAKKNRYRGRGGNNQSSGGGRGGRRRGRNRRGNNNNNNNSYSERRNQQYNEPTGPISDVGYGMLELHPKGYGFLRSPKNN